MRNDFECDICQREYVDQGCYMFGDNKVCISCYNLVFKIAEHAATESMSVHESNTVVRECVPETKELDKELLDMCEAMEIDILDIKNRLKNGTCSPPMWVQDEKFWIRTLCKSIKHAVTTLESHVKQEA